jgi:hypothetical protein
MALKKVLGWCEVAASLRGLELRSRRTSMLEAATKQRNVLKTSLWGIVIREV